MRKRVFCLFMAFNMILMSCPTVFGESRIRYDDGICEHHIVHDEECGYQEEIPEEQCMHKHDENCGYEEEAGEESCVHEHDEDCGYQEGKEGSPCEYLCDICEGEQESDIELQEEIREEEEVSSHRADTDIAYPITGGTIYFDEATGTITDYYCPSVTDDIVIPNKINGVDVVKIGDHAFSHGTRHIKRVVIPDSVVEIKNGAFANCYELESINIPNGITEIHKGTFANCRSLKNIVLPDGITKIEQDAFVNCLKLENINIPNSVTEIGYRSFGACHALKSIEIPDSVIKISRDAFFLCMSLKSVTIPGSVKNIGQDAFRECESLESVILLDGVKSIGYGAFQKCPNLKDIQMPNTLTGIDYFAFNDCTSLENVKIPDSVSVIEQYAFDGCTSLKSITLSNSLKKLNSYMFTDCTNLKTITIPDNVSSTGWAVFRNCTSLESIIIPNNITNWGLNTFENCTNLKDIYYKGTEEEWKNIWHDSRDDTIDSIFENATIHYNFKGDINKPGQDISTSYSHTYVMKSYNADTGEIEFWGDDNSYPYFVTEESDVPENLADLTNEYLLIDSKFNVESLTREIGSIHTLTGKIGKVTQLDTYTLAIDGKSYPFARYNVGKPNTPMSLGGTALILTYDGIVYAYFRVISDQDEILTKWEENRAVLGGKSYWINSITNKKNFNSMLEYIGYMVNFSYDIDNSVLLSIDTAESSITFEDFEDELKKHKTEEVTANIIFGPKAKDFSCKWVSDNATIVDFDGKGGNVVETKFDGTSIKVSDTVTLHTKKDGIATITCILSDGTETSFKVYVGNKKGGDPKIVLENAINDWVISYDNYTKEIEKIVGAKAGVAVAATSEEEIVANLEKKITDSGLELLDVTNASQEAKRYIYTTLLRMLTEEVKTELELSKIDTETKKLPKNIVNEVKKKIKKTDYYQKYGKISVAIHTTNFFGANFGTANYTDSKGAMHTISFVSSVDKVFDILEESLVDMILLDDNVLNQVYKEMYDDLSEKFFGKSISNMTEEFAEKGIEKLLGKFADKFKELKLGDAIEMLNDCYNFYKMASNVFSGDPESILKEMKNMQFKSNSVAKNAVKALEKNREKVYEALEDYIKDSVTSSKKGVRSIIQCPVDIDVFDSAGNMIAYVHDDGEIWYAENAENIIDINIIGNAKEIYSGEEDIHLKITATDEGVLNCIFEQLSDDELVKRINYYDIELYVGKEVTADITNESKEEESNVDVQVDVQESGREIPADEIVTQSNQISISCITEDNLAGEVIGGGTYTAGDMATVRAASKEGYHFLGWKNSDDILVSTSHIYMFTVKNNDTLKAIFAKNIIIDTSIDYTISFDAGDGNGTMYSITAHDGEVIKLPDCTFTAPLNKEFKSWFIDDAEYDEGDNFIVISDSVAYAIWKDKTSTSPSPSIPSKKYTITYDSNGGSGEMKSDTVEQGKEFTLPNCTFTAPDGKEFKTWKIENKEYAPNDTYLFTKDTTVYVVWKKIDASTYTITFDANGGTVTPSKMITQNDGTLSSLPTPTRNGYTFKGWYTSANGGVKVNENEVYSKDTTLYAKWEKKSSTGSSRGSSGSKSSSTVYDITVPTTNGGTISVDPKSASHGRTISIIATPNAGYELSSLEVVDANKNNINLTSKDDKQYTFTMPNSAVEINAKFQAISNSKAELPQLSSTWNNPFTDISNGTWYYDAVKFVDENNLMSGYGNGIFAPNANLSRAMLAQILYNKEGQPTVTNSNIFTDVSNEMWYAKAITWAEENGFVSGYGNNLFGPNDNITREQLAMILWRYAGSPLTENVELHFNDTDDVSDYALTAVKWAVEKGIMSGYGDGLLNPKGFATRAQVAQMFKNYLQKQ